MSRPAHSAADADAVLLRRTARQLGIQASVLVGLTVLVLAGLASLVVLNEQHAASAALLRQAATNADDVGDPPAGTWLVIRNASGQRQSPGLPAPFPDNQALDATARSGNDTVQDVSHDGRNFLVRTQAGADRTVQAVLDLAPQRAERSRLLMTLAGTGVLGLLLAALVGTLLGRRAVHPLARALALQRAFVADASHELRTPLTLLSTRAQMLQRELHRHHADASIVHDADGVVADTARLVEMVDDLLLAAEAQRQAPVSAVDLTGLCTSLAESARDYAATRQVSLTVSTADGEPPVLAEAIPLALRRAVLAVLDNAIEHTTPGGVVNLTVRRDNKNAVVDVSDTGPGIAPENLERVFDRFHSSSQKAGRRSYGLGLALARDVMARHSGSLTVAHTGPTGTTFRLSLPAVTADAP